MTRSPLDRVIVGAGIFGLWTAVHALSVGERVLVLDAGRAGQGASATPLGALMPHMPDRWTPSRQAQFEALVGLPGWIEWLEAHTGAAIGWRRCGRVVAIRSPAALPAVAQRIDGAARHWPGFSLRHVPWSADCGVAEAMAQGGLQLDDLSGRLDARALLAALTAYVRTRGSLIEGVTVIDVAPGRVMLADGTAVNGGRITVAAGWSSYPLLRAALAPLAAREGAAIGEGVRGQVAVLDHTHDDRGPIVQAGGATVVPHGGARLAVGASSHPHVAGEPRLDPEDFAFLAAAREAIPSLAGAGVVEAWVGVRPRNRLASGFADAFVGPVPGHSGLEAAIGGFKTGLMMAPSLTHALVCG